MIFEQGADFRKIIGLDVIDPENRMGIAHVHGRGSMQNWRVDWTDLQFDLARVMKWLAERDFVPGKARATHIDGKNRLGPTQAFKPPGGGLQDKPFAWRFSRQNKGDTARAVAAGLGLRTVAVVNRHECIGLGRTRFMQHHELIEGKAFATGNRARLRAADTQAAAAQIEYGDLVAEPIHFDDAPICERAQTEQILSSMASHPSGIGLRAASF